MRKIAKIAAISGVCLIGFAMPLLSAGPATAQADTKEILLQDIKAFNDRCPGAPTSYSLSCTNEAAGLSKRQQNLHLTDEDLQAAGARGGFRGGFRGDFK
jgi:hypothetical protein